MILPLAIVSDPAAGAPAAAGARRSTNSIAIMPPANRVGDAAVRPAAQSWREMFLPLDQTLKQYEKTAVRAAAPMAMREGRRSGCWSTWKAPKASARSSRRWSIS